MAFDRAATIRDDDTLHEECGVFGVWNVPDAAAVTALGPARPAASRPGSDRHRQLRRRPLPLRIAAWAWSATISAMPG